MDLLPIGRFARLCRLSIKQLRHYDELGLLRPAEVDPHTGYRYYHRDQARDALSIALLRSLDVPLPAIARVLAGDITETLAEVRDRLEADIRRRGQMVTALDRILTEGLPTVEVRLGHEPPRRVATIRDAGSPDRIPELTSACIARLLDALSAAGHPVTAPLIGLFPLDLTDPLTITAAAEADRDIPGTAPDLLPGGPCAVTTHVGPYGHISLTGHALLTWCADHGHTPSGPIREVYLNDPNTTPADQLVTHLLITLEEPQ